MSVAPIEPPVSWFYEPEPDAPQALSFSPDGKVTGHLAVWGSCHTGFLNGALAECVKPPQSRTGYENFHVGTVLTAEGEEVAVGKLTFDTNHAPLNLGMQASIRHYDHTGTLGAFLRAVDGRHGIWLSGSTYSELSPAQVQKMRANPPSGDWRSREGNLELIASLAVPVPGFPVARPQLALSASVAGEVEALILPGYRDEFLEELKESLTHAIEDPDVPSPSTPPMFDVRARRAELVASLVPVPTRDDKAYLRRRALLADKVR